MGRITGLGALALWLAIPASLSADEWQADAPPIDATVRISGGIAAIGVGYLWGRGTLSYEGQQLRFRVRGMDIGDIAAAHVRTNGLVFRLNCLADFNGRYMAVSTGAAVAAGQSVAIMQNEHGVLIELESKIVGVRINLAVLHLRVTLEQPVACSSESDRATGR